MSLNKLTRLIEHIEVDAPLPADEPHQTTWRRPMVTVAAGLVLVATGVIAVEMTDRGSRPPVEAVAPGPGIRTILWSSQVGPEGHEGVECPPEDHPDFACSSIELVSVDGHQVLSGTEWGSGAEASVPAAIHLRYSVDGEVDDLTIEVTAGEVNADEHEWAAEMPGHVPLLVDLETREIAVDFYELAALDQHGNNVNWEIGAYRAGHQPER